MKTGSFVVAVSVTAVALAAVVWIGRDKGKIEAKVEEKEELPIPNEEGPQPKAVMDETTHDFGLMETGETGKHIFTIRNDGEGVLVLLTRKEDTTCQCTFGELGKDGRAELKPGESIPINVTWTIKSPKLNFSHAAIVRTNDADNLDIQLRITGTVGRRFVILPSLDWSIGNLDGNEPATTSGSFYSEIVDEFEITKLESSSPYLTTKVRKLTDEELKEIMNDPNAEKTRQEIIMNEDGGAPRPGEFTKNNLEAKFGFRVEAVLSNEIPIGSFRGRIDVEIDKQPGRTYQFYVNASRSGPIDFFANFKCQWYPKLMALQMGDFAAADGRTSRATMFVRNCKDSIKILEVEYDESILKVDFKKDEELEGEATQRFVMSVQVPPGKLPMVRSKAKPVPVKIKTNHPDAKEFNIGIVFVSR